MRAQPLRKNDVSPKPLLLFSFRYFSTPCWLLPCVHQSGSHKNSILSSHFKRIDPLFSSDRKISLSLSIQCCCIACSWAHFTGLIASCFTAATSWNGNQCRLVYSWVLSLSLNRPVRGAKSQKTVASFFSSLNFLHTLMTLYHWLTLLRGLMRRNRGSCDIQSPSQSQLMNWLPCATFAKRDTSYIRRITSKQQLLKTRRGQTQSYLLTLA